MDVLSFFNQLEISEVFVEFSIVEEIAKRQTALELLKAKGKLHPLLKNLFLIQNVWQRIGDVVDQYSTFSF